MRAIGFRLDGTATGSAYRGNLDKLVAKVLRDRGLDLSQYRQTYLERRLAARLRALNLYSYRQYAERLDADPGEYAELLDTLTINVTEFFRDQPVWDAVRTLVLPQLIAAKRDSHSRSLRIWSAGCATGQEPYSIAMLIADALGDAGEPLRPTVLATDLDPEALAVARAGVYDVAELRHIPPPYQVRFARMKGASQFEIAPEIRQMVQFEPYSLFEDSPMRVMDAVFCRNVFIYFDRERQSSLLGQFLKVMSPGAFLVLGRSERLSPAVSELLEHVDGRERIYRKPTGR